MSRRIIVLMALVLAIALGLAFGDTAHAQTCGAVVTTVTPAGLITLASPGGSPAIASVTFTQNANARYRPPTWNSPTTVPASVPVSAASIQFYLHRAVADVATTVQMQVLRTGCDPWPTLAGAGTAVTTFPTAGALATATSTPIPSATPYTPQPIPTATPQTVAAVASNPGEVLQGNKVSLAWSGRQAPTLGDYVALARLDGTLAGPPIFTSSCASTQGITAKKEGTCLITLGTAFPTGTYLVRLYGNNNSNNVLATGSKYLKVPAAGAALLGRGQLWGTVASFVIPEVALIGGYVGMQAALNAGDPGDQSGGDKYHHIGLADFALLGDNFIEAGVWRNCTGQVPSFCGAWPYISWLDNTGAIQQRTWNGQFGYPQAPLPGNIGKLYEFKVYEVAETVWTADFCDQGLCCPIWESGLPCTGWKPSDTVPRTLLTRMKWIFGGSETPSMVAQSGLTDISTPAYCCHYGTQNWTPLNCWDQPFDSYDRNIIRATLSPCVPYAGWYAETWYR